MQIPELNYRVLPLSRVQARGNGDEKRLLDCELKIGGKWYGASGRFWTSFFARFGISQSIFRFFPHQEVFDRICQARPNTELRFCTEREVALSTSNPEKPVMPAAKLMQVINTFHGQGTKYFNGVVISNYTPSSGETKMKIGPDTFYNRYMLEAPIDGYGKPSIYLSLLREACLNGAVAYSPAFRSEVAVGDNPAYALNRALNSFDSDDGYSALRQRFQVAQVSPASLWECLRLHKRLRGLDHPGAIKAYEKVIGDVAGQYGVANLEAISNKKLRLLPAQCTMYDLINLTSELSTHHLEQKQAQHMQAWIGSTVAEEYDLEGTKDKVGDFEARFLDKMN